MEIISSLVITIVLIGVLVVAHEFGHFIVAKKNGIWVQEFAIGMGPKLFSRQKGETEYSIRMLPLGGFCRMEGETNAGEISSRSFLHKSIPVRLAVMAAGPFMNFLLAFVMIFGLTCTSYMAKPEIQEILPDSPAATIGLQEGDIIRRMDGKRIHIYDELQYILQQNHGETIQLEVSREGQLYRYALEPRLNEERGMYLIGFTPKLETGLLAESEEGYEKAGIAETAYYSYYAMINYVKMTAEGLLRVFTFTASQEEYGGPIAIFKMVGDSYEAGLTYSLKAAIQNVIYIGAVLSANLGVLNLFPIPALDGGRILFLLIEAIRRRPMDTETESKLQFLGFVFLMGLMAFVFYGDIMKFFVR
ncbi:MAG: site-2 protease family protein [Anaerotignum sp.]|nr:site-2 protease family protein [Anaerotignum sp.]